MKQLTVRNLDDTDEWQFSNKIRNGEIVKIMVDGNLIGLAERAQGIALAGVLKGVDVDLVTQARIDYRAELERLNEASGHDAGVENLMTAISILLYEWETLTDERHISAIKRLRDCLLPNNPNCSDPLNYGLLSSGSLGDETEDDGHRDHSIPVSDDSEEGQTASIFDLGTQQRIYRCLGYLQLHGIIDLLGVEDSAKAGILKAAAKKINIASSGKRPDFYDVYEYLQHRVVDWYLAHPEAAI